MNIIEKAIRLRDAESQVAAAGAPGRRQAGPGSQKGSPKAHSQVAGEPVRFQRLADIGMLPDPEQDQILIEQLRHLRRPILQNAFGPLADGVANVVMITSARPGAGKSFVSGALATALTRARELSVVIIDLDNVRATLTKGLELSDRVGFFDALDDPNISLESTLVATEIPGLRVIPTGRQTQFSAELLNSERARQLMARFSEDEPTRIIILDTPPLLSTPDAHSILDLAHQIIVVVEAGVTTESEMKQLLESIRSDKPVGLVLNKAVGGMTSLYGGEYYGTGNDPS